MTHRIPMVDLPGLIPGLEASVIGAFILTMHPEGPLLTYVNPAFEQLVQVPAAGLLGRPCTLLQDTEPDGPGRVALQRALETGQPVTVQLPVGRPGLRALVCEVTLQPTRDERGAVTQVLGFVQDVTAREDARSGEARAWERLRATLDRLPELFVSCDRQLRVTSINAAAARAFGRPAGEGIGQPLASLSLDAAHLPLVEAATRALQTGLTQQVHVDLQHRELDAAVYVTDGGVAAVLRDVTEVRHLQREVQSSEDRFSAVFTAAPLPITISRLRDGQILDANPAFLDFSGYRRDDIIGRTSVELQLWPEPEQRAAAIEPLQAQGTTAERNVAVRLKGGERRSVILSMVRVMLEGEACLVTLLRDVSEEQRIQSRLELSEQAARVSAAELQRTLDQSPDMIVSIDGQGRFITVSAASQRLLGYPPAEMQGQPFVAFIHPEDRERSVQAAAQPETLQGSATFHNRYLRRDGSVVWMEWSSVQMLDGVLYAVARDITARRAATEDQAFLAAIVQASPDAIIGLTLDWTIRSWNGGAERMYGYPAETILGHPVTEIVPPDLLEEERGLLTRAAQVGSPGTELEFAL